MLKGTQRSTSGVGSLAARPRNGATFFVEGSLGAGLAALRRITMES